mmetsp:Transcript_17986/g.48550  ORF Transcript_17986/g.48550 Transcript_17986/m.48550 type:complete len:176 (+) Transcript_17986:321-848(+)|eukprot:3833297-Prymnesium_polylepis.2
MERREHANPVRCRARHGHSGAWQPLECQPRAHEPPPPPVVNGPNALPYSTSKESTGSFEGPTALPLAPKSVDSVKRLHPGVLCQLPSESGPSDGKELSMDGIESSWDRAVLSTDGKELSLDGTEPSMDGIGPTDSGMEPRKPWPAASGAAWLSSSGAERMRVAASGNPDHSSHRT